MEQPQRQSNRLNNYNYSSPGWYYLTICTQNRQCLLGKIINGTMILNEFGKITKEKTKGLGKYQNINIDVYCIMPNHIHLIIRIVGTDPCVRPVQSGLTRGSTPTIGQCVKRLKTLTTHIYIQNVKNNRWPPFDKRLWQRNYYDHIIRNETDLNKIRRYIKNNPAKWGEDEMFQHCRDGPLCPSGPIPI